MSEIQWDPEVKKAILELINRVDEEIEKLKKRVQRLEKQPKLSKDQFLLLDNFIVEYSKDPNIHYSFDVEPSKVDRKMDVSRNVSRFKVSGKWLEEGIKKEQEEDDEK